MKKYTGKVTPILMVLLLVLMIAVGFGVFKINQSEQKHETKLIDIPVESSVVDKTKQPVLLPASEKNDTGIEIKETEDDLQQQAGQSVLPILEQSDDSFIQAVKKVSESLANWFQVKQVIRQYIVLINDLSQNQMLYKHRLFLKPPKSIVVKKEHGATYMAVTSYQRYDEFANAISAIDVEQGIKLYQRYKPLFQQVFNQFGYPDQYRLEDIFIKSAASVIEAPIIRQRIALLAHGNNYKFADRKLESLDKVKKLMLRMGPENTLKIQQKLRVIVEAFTALNE